MIAFQGQSPAHPPALVRLATHQEAAGVGGLTPTQPSILFPTLSAGCQRLYPPHLCSLLFQLSLS